MTGPQATAFGSGGVGLGGGAPAEGSMGPDGVVVAGEPVQLALQPGHRGGGRLGGQPPLLGLVEPLHLAAGLRMVGPGVADPNSAQPELHLQRDPALAALFPGEHCPRCRSAPPTAHRNG
jgi:hypothetical protein